MDSDFIDLCEQIFDSTWWIGKVRYWWDGCSCCGKFRRGWIKPKDYRSPSKPKNSKKKTLRTHRGN